MCSCGGGGTVGSLVEQTVVGWTCWSEYGECVVSKGSGCGAKGVKKRTRKCLGGSSNCFGASEETISCVNTNCSNIGKFYISI